MRYPNMKNLNLVNMILLIIKPWKAKIVVEIFLYLYSMVYADSSSFKFV